MPAGSPALETLVLVCAFAAVYMMVVLRRTLYGRFDLYDFFMLSTVAIVPAAFTLFPNFANLLSQLSGVAFPFVLMFGILFLIVFVFMHRMTARLHKLERQNCTLIQELSMLALDLDTARRGQRNGA